MSEPTTPPAQVPAEAAKPASQALTSPKPTDLDRPSGGSLANYHAAQRQAEEAESRRVWSSKGPVWTGVISLLVLLGGFFGWALLSSIDGAIIAPGVIQVEQNRQIVQHLDGGVVAEINVTEAQTVQAGDLLIRLDGTTLKAELAIVEGQLYDALARRARLEAERDDKPEPSFPPDLLATAATRPDVAEMIEGQRVLFASRLETVTAQISQLNKRRDQIAAQVQGITAQAAAVADQIALIEPEIADQQKLLDKGLTQAVRLIDLKREVARLEGNKGELDGNLASAEGRATEIELQILQLQSARREEANTQLRDMGDKLLELAERHRALSERVARLEIRAPVSGVVLGLQVTTPQAVLRPAEPVLYIIPQDRPLIIVAQIPTIHVDEVHIGQHVEVVFAAFSARTTPTLNGHVVTVSADAMTDEANQISFYRAEIELEPGEMEKLEGQVLIPGMPVQAFVNTGTRSPMVYLLKPFTDYLHMAFRES